MCLRSKGLEEISGQIPVPDEKGLRDEAEGLAVERLVDSEDLRPYAGLSGISEMALPALFELRGGVDPQRAIEMNNGPLSGIINGVKIARAAVLDALGRRQLFTYEMNSVVPRLPQEFGNLAILIVRDDLPSACRCHPSSGAWRRRSSCTSSAGTNRTDSKETGLGGR